MRNKLQTFIFYPWTAFFVLIITGILSYLWGAVGYYVGLGVVLFGLILSGFKFSVLGLSRPIWREAIPKAFVYSVLLYLGMDIVIQPLLEIVFGRIDLSNLEGIKGNFVSYLLFILFMWGVAAFGEEFIYRSYLVKHIAGLFSNEKAGWIISSLLVGSVFGLAHMYQGVSGVITTGLLGVVLGLVFYRNEKNLWLAILTHGIYDMIGITLIYLDCERAIADWVIGLLT